MQTACIVPLHVRDNSNISATINSCRAADSDLGGRRKHSEMMDLLLLFTIASLSCSASSLPGRQFRFINELKNWTEAQSFCRETFTDLVTINSTEDVRTLNNMADLNTMLYMDPDFKYRAWIGLFDDVNSWRWSISDANFYKYGEAEFRNWGPGEPNNAFGAESCVGMWDHGQWNDNNCDLKSKVVCYHAQGQNASFILSNQSMTWTEAQRYCRQNHTDLASVRNSSEFEQIKQLIKSAGGEQVWIGLYRNTWTWADGSNFTFRHWKTSEPAGAQENCAAAALQEDGRWEDRPCGWKMPFFCYSSPVSKHVVKLKLETRSSLDLSDAAVLEDLLKQLKQKLRDGRDGRVDGDVKLTWRTPSDREVSHKDGS